MILSRVLFHSRFQGFLRDTAASLLLVLSASVLPVSAQVEASGNNSQPAASAPGSPVVGGASKLTFDAASIRPSTQKFFFKGNDFLDPVSDSAPPKGGLFSWNVPMMWLIDFAYDLRGLQVRREVAAGLPKSMRDEWYAIEARADGNPTRADVRQMVRSMLEERFQFTGHLERAKARCSRLRWQSRAWD
jgi:Protein of unknown function (DUF3738)